MSVATARNLGVRVVATLAISACALLLASRGMAQGVTTGAVRGRALDQAGQPIAGASVQLVNSQSGLRYTTVSSSSGGYYLANVIVGAYAIEARAIGYRPARNANVDVRLGVVADIELRLEAATVELAAINVAGEAETGLMSRGRTGVTSTVSGDLLQNLPSLNRSFLTSASSSPLINGGSVAGQADRFNTIQIDGGTNGDLFGLNASNGSPGGKNSSRPISVEAVSEYQVLIAPYDVRQGGFTGGLVNAVTRSGTNQFHGSLFGFYQSDNLQGKDSLGVPASQFDRKFYGFTVGGPIVRDRLHFFVSAEWRSDDQAYNLATSGQVRNINPGDTVGSPTCRPRTPPLTGSSCWNTAAAISATTAERMRQVAIDSLNYDPGDWRRPTIPNPDRSLFFKLSGQLGANSQAELAYTNTQSSQLILTHDPFNANPTRLREGYQYDQSGYDNSSTNHSVRARLNSRFSNLFTNEVIASFYKVDDVREMPNPVSLMIVGADSAGAHLALGGERFSHVNTLAQDILEVADNLTITTGQHVFTLGGRYERFAFTNNFFAASLGAWYFPDTTSFIAQAPTRYERALPGVYGDSVLGKDNPYAVFTFKQFGFYGQDQVNVSRTLRLTLGLRVDFTSLPQPAYNPLLDTATVTVGPNTGLDFGVRTDNRPTDAVLFSPRFGFNYDVRGDQSFNIRGGAGIFSGRTPYVWASNAYTNTGLEQLQLTCTAAAANVPVFTIDPASQYTQCAGGGALALPKPAIVYFDQSFKLPQRFSASLGMDRRLPWEMIGTVDLLYSRAINQFILEDVNLVEGGTSLGEANRRLYANNANNTLSAPRRATTVANDVLRQFNSNQDYSYSVSLTLTKNVRSTTFNVGYAYARSYDLISPTSDISNSLLNFSTLDGTMSHRNLRPSLFDQPHTVRVAGTTVLPYGFRFSLSYTGNSGRPYAYRYNTDVNGDNFSGNDLFYVPLNAQDISMQNPSQYTALDNFINGEKCLSEHRGQIMQRNSCRNPWQSFVDARLAKSFPTMRGQQVEFTMNAFNVLALMGIGGISRVTSSNENIAILNRTGYSTALSRGIYSLQLPTRNVVQYPASRWKLEFGMRYSF